MDIDRWAMFIEFNPNNPLEIKSYGIHFYGICLNCLEKSKDVIEAITVQKDFNIDELGEFIRSQASNVLSQLAGFYQPTTTKN
jgi:hypothetical protein